MWFEFANGDATFALHHLETLPPQTGQRVQLAMVSHQKLEMLVETFKDKGIVVEGIVDEAFGRSGPDRLVMQINEHNEALYT